MKTTLELYCEFAGWSGGTIHQALTEYQASPIQTKDSFCNKVLSYGIKNLVDPQIFLMFTRARL